MDWNYKYRQYQVLQHVFRKTLNTSTTTLFFFRNTRGKGNDNKEMHFEC